MNIFYLDKDPELAAQYHCDKHCVKMILESAQMLSTCHRVLDGDDIANEVGLYKNFGKNHPCNIWIRNHESHYFYLFDLYMALGEEYTYRYGKEHKSMRFLDYFENPPENLVNTLKYDLPLCMPDEVKIEDDVESSYRNYYKISKAPIATWNKKRPAPYWWD